MELPRGRKISLTAHEASGLPRLAEKETGRPAKKVHPGGRVARGGGKTSRKGTLLGKKKQLARGGFQLHSEEKKEHRDM